MLDETIAKVSEELQQEGYLVDLHPRIPGVQALLYSWSPKRYSRTTSLNPWYGGEVGQVVFVELEKKQ